MSHPFRIVGALVAAALLVAGAGIASAATKSKAKVKFSTKASKHLTSLDLSASFAPDISGNYRILTDTQLKLPTGTKINPAALPTCDATDDQINADPGGAAKVCPPASKLGTGTADVIIVGPPIHFTGNLFNQKKRILLELYSDGKPAYEIGGDIKGSTIDFKLEGAEQLGTKPTKVHLNITKHGTAKKPYLRTPPDCSKTGKWKGSMFNQYGGPSASADVAKFTIPCKTTFLIR